MKNLKFLFVAVLCSTMLVSCLVDDEDETLDALTNTPYTIGFQSSTSNESFFEDVGAIERSYPVIIIGGQDGTDPTSDITVNYSVNTELSTATEGVEFDFVNTGGTLTIPSGSNFANFNILLNTGNLDPNQPTQLVLDLTSASSSGTDAVVAAQAQRIAITFIGCNSQIALPGTPSTYSVVTVRDSDGAVFNRTENITWIGPNTFQTDGVGLYGINSIAPDTSMDFQDICAEIIVPDQGLAQGFYGNEVGGAPGADGEVDQETLNFVMRYFITFGGEPTYYTATFTRL